jgi:phosphotransferase system HPr (HPr) family protein
MPAIQLTVNHPSGLHARPAALFVNAAKLFSCEITLRNLTTDKPAVNAKSILSVITQGVNQGHQIELTTQGADADEALQSLKELIESNFGEKIDAGG